MALYRNIAGIPDKKSMGIALQSPSTYSFSPTTSTIPVSTLPGLTRTDLDAAYDQLAETKRNRYDWLMSHSIEEITADGYYVADNGTVFQWIDQATGYSKAFLAIQDIQQIENERGTAGALLLHMQEPAIAKDTAGYQGGASATWYEQNGVTDPTTKQVVAPITEVEVLPPVTAGSDGGIQFEAPNYQPTPNTTTTTTTTTTTPTASTPLPVDRQTALKNNWLPLAVMAGIVAATLVEGLPRRRLIALGGVGTLFYLMAKKQ